ncbi:MAG: M48 family metalloprotease [Acidobacteriota bacterium]|nr:M48 family metalloprotease [Acidobacteriota bacterium]
MKYLWNKLSAYWFAEAPAERLAVLRILIGAFALYYVGVRYDMFVKIAETESSLFAPVGVAAFLNAPIGVGLFQAILIATLAANVAFILGWWHRFTGPLFAGLLMWLLCYRNSWSMIFHSDNAMVMHVLVMGLAASADAYSLDALRSRRQGLPTQSSNWRYGWPVRLMCALTVTTYFVAGVAKLASHGLSWGSGEALRGQIAVDGLRKELLGDTGGALSYALYDQIWLFTLLGVGTLVLELGAPLVLANRRLGMLWAVNVWLMHWGILFIMGITFRYQLAGFIFLSFFKVERLAEVTRAMFSTTLPTLFSRFNPRIAHLIAAACLCGAPLAAIETQAQTATVQPANLQAERPSKKTREYEKLRFDALKAYHNPKDDSFRKDVDEAYRQKQREHAEYAMAINLGDQSNPQISRTKDKLKVEDALYENLLIQNYINRVGQSLVPKESKRLYSFKVILSPFPEARSLATGTVYVSTGLLSLMDNEAQLAYILAHEIAHVEKNHWFDDVMIERLVDKKRDRQRKINNMIAFTSLNMSRAFSGWTGVDQVVFRVYSRFGLKPLLKTLSPNVLTAWDRVHEDEADNLALKYMLNRSYDPREAQDFYANLYSAAKEETNLQYGFTATEERIGERVQTLNAFIQFYQPQNSARSLTSGAVNLAANKTAQPELAARQTAAQKQLAYFINSSSGAGKSFNPSRSKALAISAAQESEIKKKLEQGVLIADAPEFVSLMATIKRDNGIRAFQSDLFNIARVNLNEALWLRNDDALAHYYKGRVWMQTARESADKVVAVNAFRQAVNLDTVNRLPEPRLHLALALLDSGKPTTRLEAALLLKSYAKMYQASHNGAEPPEALAINEYLRDANTNGLLAQPSRQKNAQAKFIKKR